MPQNNITNISTKLSATQPKESLTQAGLRALLSQLRDIMAEHGQTKGKLTHIVRSVAEHMAADVCSIYLTRENDVLELFATKGLKQEAVHQTQLQMGEGLVGNVALHACPIAVAEAAKNPHYAYRQETGEEKFTSLCAVPIIRQKNTLGVLVVQNREKHHYTETETEALQTVSMVLAEMIASGEIISRQELASLNETIQVKPQQINGKIFSKGISFAPALVYAPHLDVSAIVCDDPVAETKLLRQALVKMHTSIDIMIRRTDKTGDDEAVEVLEAYQLFAKDKGWVRKLEKNIGEGLSAEASVERVLGEMRSRMEKVEDRYIRERLSDIEDISQRLIAHLSRLRENDGTRQKRPRKFVLVAKQLGPAALLDYEPGQLRGVILEGGGASNHVAIMARALDIPLLGQCGDVVGAIETHDKILLDAEHGVCYINPSEHIRKTYRRRTGAKARSYNLGFDLKDKKAVTLDGVDIELHVNAGLMAEVPQLHDVGADGVGLFRTELSFMGWSKYPRVVLQAELYGKIMDEAKGKPVTFRTLDIGGDKPLPYFKGPEEENPALGWRAIRIAMDRPAVLRTQVRAMILAAQGRPIRVLLPLVSEVAELDRAKELIQMEVDRCKKRDEILPEKIEIGVMIEVPSILWQLDQLLSSVDFIAVGSNDLMQYLFAVDYRGDATKHRFDSLSPPMLRMLKTLAKKVNASGVEMCLCGEMAGNPMDAAVLIALGFKKLSMQAQSIGPIKQMVLSLNAGALRGYVNKLMAGRDHSLRNKLLDYARDHDIVVADVNGK